MMEGGGEPMATIEVPAALDRRIREAAVFEGTDIETFVKSTLEEKLRQMEPKRNGTPALPERPTSDEIAGALSEGKIAPSEAARIALREIARRQEGRPETPGEDTLQMIRDARAGGLYGLDPGT